LVMALGRQRSQAERYRRAAQLAIEQLDWSINYLYRIQRPAIGDALRQNRNAIVRRHHL